jgi:hypothetical protein
MPFSQTTDEHTKGYWDDQFGLIESAVEEVGLQARRSSPIRGSLLSQIIADLFTSPIVVADLSDRNPNVYWELGVRQSLSNGTIIIAEESTQLPFDVRDIGVLTYNRRDAVSWDEFRGLFKTALKHCLDNPEMADSPVLSAISGRGSLYSIFRSQEISRRIEALLSEIQRNEELIELARKYVRHNQRGSGRTYLSGRFRSAATQSLIAERYLDQPSLFYEAAELYYDLILRINEQVNLCRSSPERTESYIQKHSDSWKYTTGLFREFIVEARTGLLK